MASAGTISIAFTANTGGLKRGTDKARKHISGFSVSATQRLSSLSDKFTKLGLAAAGAFAAFKVVSFPISLAAQAEQTAVSFKVLLGSASEAKSVMEDLSNFAASTPFQTDEINKAATSLVSMGVTSENLIPTLKNIGNVAAGLNIPFSELSEVYAKIKTQGRVMGDDILQLSGRGIPIIQELAKQFGVAESEVRNLVSSGKVGFPEIEQAFQNLTSEGGKFAGLMEAQSKTTAGSFSTLKDNLTVLMREVGFTIIEGFNLNQVTQNITKFIQDSKGKFTNFLSKVKSVFQGISFVIANWQNFLKLGFKNATLSIVKFYEETKHLLTEKLPQYIGWFGENFISIITQTAKNVWQIFKNLGSNIVDLITNLPKLIKGEKSFSDIWTPITEGAKFALKDLPEIPDRIKTDYEQMLEQDIAGIKNALGEDYYNRFLKDTSKATEAVENLANKSGGIKAPTRTGPVKLASVAEFGTQQARDAILKFRFGSNNDPLKEQVKVNKDNLNENKKHTDILKDIASNKQGTATVAIAP